MPDRYAVIGHPIAHSRSPEIHAAFAQATGQDLTYEKIDIAPEDLESFLTSERGRSYSGLNVTIPHKEAVARLVSCSPSASKAGAVNTLTRHGDSWRGDNTDGTGLCVDLERLGFAISGRSILLLGAGGAARGALVALLELGPAKVTVVNRTMSRARALAATHPGCVDTVVSGIYDALINATSSGLDGASLNLQNYQFAADAWAYDLSYGHAARGFLSAARERGFGACADGWGMLVEQAAASFRIWRDLSPPTRDLHESEG